MFFTLTKGFVAHALWRHFLSWFFLLAALGVATALPFVVYMLHEVASGGAEVPLLLTWWPYVYGAAFVFAAVTQEIAGFYFYRNRVKNLDHTDLDEIITPLTQRAGIPVPTIVEIPNGPMNAGAMHSLLFGGKLIVSGQIKTLLSGNPRAFLAVLAHEIAHLKHRDSIMTWVLQVAHKAVQWNCVVVLLAAIGSPLFTPDHGISVWHTLLLMWGTSTLVGVLAAAVIRNREYLADVGAHALTKEYELRDDLISALVSLERLMTGWHPMRILRRTGWSLFQTHPSTADRARALRVTSYQGRDGSVTIAALDLH